MLKNEFQLMIEQYSNELMNISRQSGGEIPASAQPEAEEVPASAQPEAEEVPASAQPEAEEVPASAQPITEDVPASAQPITEEVPASAQPSIEEAAEKSAIPVQNTNISQSAPSQQTQSAQRNAAQPRDIPRNTGETLPQSPINTVTDRNDSEDITYEQFLQENPGSGQLKVQVFSGDQVVPIPNAEVVVSKTFSDGKRIFFRGLTDISGIVDGIQLPAPSRELSESPQPRGDGVAWLLPYSQYNITINDVRYIPQEYTHVPVFDGIKSIQPVRMTPIQFSNGNGETIVFPESEPNSL